MNDDRHELDQLISLTGITKQKYTELINKNIIEEGHSLVKSLSILVRYYKDNNELRLAKLRLDRETLKAKKKYMDNVQSLDTGDMNPILRLEKLQKIRLDKAKEYEVWSKIKTSKMDTLNPFELIRMLTPFLHVIKNSLNQLAMTTPALQPAIDASLISLAELGERVVESANEDIDAWVKEQSTSNEDIELSEVEKSLLGIEGGKK